jgi:transposase
MAKARTLVGLDVHATKVVAAVLDVETGELAFFSMTADIARVAGFCAGLPGPVRAAYEAGPTGYGLARELARREVGCVVAAPSKIPRGSGERVKTDRRDAELLARLLLAGKLHPVRVPGCEEEALRDLIRAREAVRVDLMRCRHRLSKLLLRHGIRFEDGDAWTTRHQQWLSTITLAQPAAQATLLDARGAVDALVHRREQLEREIVALLPGSPWSVQSSRLRCMRGLDTLSAVGLGAEVGDFASFRKPAQLMMTYELPRAGPLRDQHRPAAQARVDHQDRLHARGVGCWSRRPGTTANARGSEPRSPNDKPTSPPRRSRSPGPRNAACTAPGHDPSNATNARP